MKGLICLVCGLAVSAAFALGFVDPASVKWEQTGNGRVEITYTLSGAAAPVAIDMLADGEPVDAAEQAGLSGDVNTRVEPGERKIVWLMQTEKCITSKLPKGAWSVRFKVGENDPARDAEYLAVKCDDGAVAYYASAAELPVPVTDAQWKDSHILLRRIHADGIVARIGLNPREYGNAEWGGNNRFANQAATAVEMDGDYYIAVYEMTIGQYLKITGKTESGISATGRKSNWPQAKAQTHYTLHQTDWVTHPMDNICYTDSAASCATLEARTGLAFAMPTEAQWEFACRAGSPADQYTGCYGSTSSGDIASLSGDQKTYYGSACGQTTHHPNYANALPVGTKRPNAWGLYDMLGNLREWTSTSVVKDGTSYQVVKGGDMAMTWNCSTCGSRQLWSAGMVDYRTGYRIVCNIPAGK